MSKIKRENYFYSNISENQGIAIVNCGYEKCLPNHYYGPAVRDYYLIHIVIDGKGVFEYKDKAYEINKNQGFIIFPDEITKYTADSEKPWYYYWVGFNGLYCKQILSEFNLNLENPVITSENSEMLIKNIISLYHKGKADNFNQFTMTGYLYLIFSCLKRKSHKSNKEKYVDKALEYIKNNFMNEIKVSEIADYLYLERSYFYKLFKNSTGFSPLEYITKYRLNVSCDLLKNSNHSVTNIAGYVGFSSCSSFGKAFKKEFNISPLRYRKN